MARNRLRNGRLPAIFAMSASMVTFALVGFIVFAYLAYNFCRIDVPAKHIAVLTHKTGIDLANNEEVAPTPEHKGLQIAVLNEGRYFRNPYNWDWAIYPMVEIPEGKIGVRVRLYGQNLGYGDFVTPKSSDEPVADPDQNFKGIVPEVLRSGRYAINALVKNEKGEDVNRRSGKNDYVEIVEIHDPVTIPAGYEGVVTNLAGPMPKNPNQFLVETGFRGVQEKTLKEGTHYLNPYMFRVQPINTRSQRFDLAKGGDMGFPSKDGFWVSLDGSIEFRVKPEEAALVYVMYDETKGNVGEPTTIDEEIIRKVIMPNARAFCRLRGSDSSGREFIDGETRSKFQSDFQEAIRRTCEEQGIEILHVTLAEIKPPQAIAKPVQDREVYFQKLAQYRQQKLQQDEEAKLATEMALVEQGQQLVEADREVVKLVTEAKRRQDVALAEANRDKSVAEEELAATKDLAAAVLADKGAEAEVIKFENEAEAAGWKAAVAALDGDGRAYARYVLYQKLAPGFKTIMTNTADSPLMKIFDTFSPSNARED